MAKMYTEELKYAGNGDSLDDKLVIFYDICSRADGFAQDHVCAKWSYD